MYRPLALLPWFTLLFFSCGDKVPPGFCSELDQQLHLALLEERMDSADSMLVLGDERKNGEINDLHLGYYRARLAFARLHRHTALDSARYWMKIMLTKRDSVHPEVVVSCAQLLAELHHEWRIIEDSVTFYRDLSRYLMEDEVHPMIEIRDYLVTALVAAEQLDWQRMEYVGKEGLRKAKALNREQTELFGRLLIAVAFARKSMADYGSGDERQKEKDFLESLDTLREAKQRLQGINSPRWREAQRDMATVATRLSDEELFWEALEPLRAEPPDATGIGSPERLMGYFYIRRGRYEKAIENYRLFLNREGVLFERRLYDEAMYSIRVASVALGQYRNAFETIKEEITTLSICRYPGRLLAGDFTAAQCREGYQTLLMTSEVAKLYLSRYEAGGSNSDLEMANALDDAVNSGWERSLERAREQLLINELTVLMHRIPDNSIRIKYAWARKFPGKEAYERLFEAMERGKAFLLNRELEDYASQKEGSVVDLLAEKSELEVQYEMIRAGETKTANVGSKRDIVLSRLREVEEKLQSVMVTDVDNGPTNRIDLAGVRRYLGDETGYLSYSEVGNQLFGLYLDRDTSLSFRAEVPLDSIIAMRKSLLLALDTLTPDSATEERYIRYATQLYRTLLGPIDNQTRTRKKLILSANGHLQTLPFAALLTTRPTDGATSNYSTYPYFGKRNVIRYVPSWRVDRLHAEQRILDYRATPRIGVWTHPSFQLVFQDVTAALLRSGRQGSAAFVGDEGGSDHFLRRANQYDLLHFSVHAKGNPGAFQDNYLYFDRLDSLGGYVIGREKFSASLVVLSACSTTLGQVASTEGTISLQRSFHRAGVPDVLSTQWEVPAVATAHVILAFYERLFDGQDTATALALAQSDCWTGQLGPEYTWPGYWGGLVMG